VCGWCILPPVERILAAAAAFALAHAAGASAPRHAMQFSTLQCDAATVYAEKAIAAVRIRGRSVVFGKGVDLFFLPGASRSWGLEGKGEVAPPPAGLVDAIPNGDGDDPITNCPGFRHRLRALRVPWGAGAHAEAVNVPRERPFRSAILRISLPALSPDGRHAVLGVSQAFQGQDGGAWLVYLVRGKDDRWEVAGESGLWVA
jgi:hypothetical protein